MDYACLFATLLFCAVLCYACVRSGGDGHRNEPPCRFDPDGQREWWG